MEQKNEKQRSNSGRAARETTVDTGSQGTGAELQGGQGVQLVGMKQGVLQGCMGIIEEAVEGKAQILLVGGVRRVQMDTRKLRTDLKAELVEILPPDFAEVGLHAHLGITPGATKEDIKAAYKKMVLRLHPDKNKNNEEK